MYQLEFSEEFEAIIVLNAKLPKKDFFDRFSSIPILAADGAAISLYKLGVTADKVIGDLDSFYSHPKSANFNNSQIIFDSNQDTNDFEKTLLYCINNGIKQVLITGIHGGEYEHSLNNWSVFIRYSKVLDLIIYDKKRYGLCLFNSATFESYEGEIISLIPNGTTKLSTCNLQWELQNEILEISKREGARNISKDKNIAIEVHDGSLTLFIDARLPYAIKKISL